MCIEVSNEMRCFVKAHCLGRALFHTSGVDPGEKSSPPWLLGSLAAVRCMHDDIQ